MDKSKRGMLPLNQHVYTIIIINLKFIIGPYNYRTFITISTYCTSNVEQYNICLIDKAKSYIVVINVHLQNKDLDSCFIMSYAFWENMKTNTTINLIQMILQIYFKRFDLWMWCILCQLWHLYLPVNDGYRYVKWQLMSDLSLSVNFMLNIQAYKARHFR